jgi:copper(I)-binding protein
MTRRRLARAVLALTALAFGACVYYPRVVDVGGVRIQPANGRVVRDGDHALFYADLNNTGKFGDTLTRAESPVAGRAELVGPAGTRLTRLEVPGEMLVRFEPGGRRIVLSELTRALEPGEVVIVTLVFEKTGALGVIASVE